MRRNTSGNRFAVASRCIKDRGNPGKGPNYIGPLRKGALKRFGYSSTKPLRKRHLALDRAAAASNAMTVFYRLNAVAVLTKNVNPSLSRKFKGDAEWVRRKFRVQIKRRSRQTRSRQTRKRKRKSSKRKRKSSKRKRKQSKRKRSKRKRSKRKRSKRKRSKRKRSKRKRSKRKRQTRKRKRQTRKRKRRSRGGKKLRRSKNAKNINLFKFGYSIKKQKTGANHAALNRAVAASDAITVFNWLNKYAFAMSIGYPSIAKQFKDDAEWVRRKFRVQIKQQISTRKQTRQSRQTRKRKRSSKRKRKRSTRKRRKRKISKRKRRKNRKRKTSKKRRKRK